MPRSDGRASARHRRRSHETDARAVRLRERHGLTAQEARVALLIADGYTVKDIAATLDVTVFTVRAHLRAIFAKMGVGRQAALVRVVLTAKDTEK